MEQIPLNAAATRRNKESLVACVHSPFINPAPWTSYEVFKAFFLGFTLFPIRLVILILVLIAQISIARMVSCCYPLENDRGCLYHTRAMSACRRAFLLPVVLLNRLVLWSFGFWYIRIHDCRKHRSERPKVLVAAPHSSLLDACFLAYAFPIWPSAVGKKELLNSPLLGPLCAAFQNIMVDRTSATSREACKDAIALRASSEWKGPPLLLFPEGTCTNAKVLIQFKPGAFSPGKPVVPVLLRCPYRHFNIAWVDDNANLGVLLFRMMTQFINFCEILILDTYNPSENECSDPKLFAKNVRSVMAESIGVPTTEHSYDDAFLSFDGNKAGVGSDFIVREMRDKYKFEFDELKYLLQKFNAVDKEGTGKIEFKAFAETIGTGEGRSLQSLDRLFAFLDTDDSGFVSYREFVQYAALLNGKCSSSSRAKLAFLMYDTTGSGVVKYRALCAAVDEAVLYVPATEPNVIGAESQHQLAGDGSPGTQLLLKLGRKEDDEISFSEFAELVEKHPHVLEAGLQMARDRLGMQDLGKELRKESPAST